MIFKTDRLSVRKLVANDFDRFHQMQSDDEVMKYTSKEGKGIAAGENQKQLQECICAYEQAGNQFWVWAIEDQTGQFVGTCAIVQNEKQESELGYRFLRVEWGNGYGTEIIDPLLDYGCKTLDYDVIVAYVDVRNVASVKILNRSKMDFLHEIHDGDVLDRKYEFRGG